MLLLLLALGGVAAAVRSRSRHANELAKSAPPISVDTTSAWDANLGCTSSHDAPEHWLPESRRGRRSTVELSISPAPPLPPDDAPPPPLTRNSSSLVRNGLNVLVGVRGPKGSAEERASITGGADHLVE